MRDPDIPFVLTTADKFNRTIVLILICIIGLSCLFLFADKPIPYPVRIVFISLMVILFSILILAIIRKYHFPHYRTLVIDKEGILVRRKDKETVLHWNNVASISFGRERTPLGYGYYGINIELIKGERIFFDLWDYSLTYNRLRMKRTILCFSGRKNIFNRIK